MSALEDTLITASVTETVYAAVKAVATEARRRSMDDYDNGAKYGAAMVLRSILETVLNLDTVDAAYEAQRLVSAEMARLGNADSN